MGQQFLGLFIRNSHFVYKNGWLKVIINFFPLTAMEDPGVPPDAPPQEASEPHSMGAATGSAPSRPRKKKQNVKRERRWIASAWLTTSAR